MTEIDDLPADQRAILQLLVKQGQTYEDLSGLLNIDPPAVRERAHAALEALGPDTGRRLSPERRAEISDYLLGPPGGAAPGAGGGGCGAGRVAAEARRSPPGDSRGGPRGRGGGRGARGP